MAAGTSVEPPVRVQGVRYAARKRRVAYWLLTPAGLYLLMFLIVPMGMLVYTSLQSGGLFAGGFYFDWNFANYTAPFVEHREIFARSVTFSAIVTVACLLLAYPMMYWTAFYAGRWKSSILLLILVPFFVSFVIRTIQWRWLLGDFGLLFAPLKELGLLPQGFRVIGTPVAVVAGITYNYLPFTALPLYVALERIDRSLVEAAKDLYSSKWQAFRRVVWPLSIPGVFAAFLLTFVPATGDFVNAFVLGLRAPGTVMIGNIIQEKFLHEIAYPQAAALSVILMVAMLILGTIYARILGTEDQVVTATV